MNAQSDQFVSETDTSLQARPERLGFGVLFWAAQDAVIVGDIRSGHIVLWNPAAERIFGYSAEEAVGMQLEHLFPERFREQHRQARLAYLAEGPQSPNETGRTREMLALNRSGAEISIEFSASLLERHGNSYVLGIVRDVTTRKRAQTERDALLATARDTARRMRELAALKADFTAMVAHELGTPLAAIRALIDLLDRDEIPPSSRQRVLATIRTEIQLLQRLVADIHVTDTFERDDFTIRPRPMAVATLLAEAAASSHSALANHDFRVEPAPMCRVQADPERIGQVLRNLLGNAAKHTPPGTRIVLRARQANDRVHVEIADSGPGIHPDDLARVFSKFGRGRDAEDRRLPGTGLGLYLSRRIVEAHGGQLIVDSELGYGTTFRFDMEVVR